MATWSNTKGLRGSTLEELVNRTNDLYRTKGLALIQKIPTPITPVQMGKDQYHISMAYFEQKSTVDYIGVVQGVPVCFEAKECIKDSYDLKNVREHQISFMIEFEKQGGVSFVLLYYSARNELFYIPLKDFLVFWERAKNGGRKSFCYRELNQDYYLHPHGGYFVPYLDGLSRDLASRD